MANHSASGGTFARRRNSSDVRSLSAGRKTTTPAFVQGWMGMFNSNGSTFDLGALPAVWTLAAPLYILGGLLFGIATFRAGILPRWAGVLLAAGTLLAPIAKLLPNASQPKTAIPVGLALAWLGYALWSERRPQTS